MPSLQIQYNRRSVAARFDRFERDYPTAVISEVMPEFARLVLRDARRTRTFKNRTGNLRRGLGFRVLRARALEIQFTYGVPYGVYVDQGTRHIRARRFWETAIVGNERRLPRMLERETRRQAQRAGL